MINFLIVEDDIQKKQLICAEVISFFGDGQVKIEHAETFSDAVRLLHSEKFDLIAMDLLLPRRRGDDPSDMSEEIIENLRENELNSTAITVALSQFPNVVADRQSQFVESGILLISFDKKNDNWKGSLNICLQKVQKSAHFDFVIICALEKERTAFRSTDCDVGQLQVIAGLDCLKLSVGDLHGVCVKIPRMGIVDASIVAANAISKLTPKLVCMAGICGGFSDEVALGTLVISDPCWEHQAGKWAENAFQLDHYQIALENSTRITLSQFIQGNGQFPTIKQNLTDDASIINQDVLLAPTVTGSAVIANKEKMDEIKGQHRKLAGLDMEMYGLYRAAGLSNQTPICFGAKVVVDLADSAKDDKIHTYGCVVSARFTIDAIQELLA